MNRLQTRVFHWRYEDGWRDTPTVLLRMDPTRPEKEFNEEIVGWHCWVYAEDDNEFEYWMAENMQGPYDVTRRFNSGDPMSTVWIHTDEDATMFKLKWM